MFTIRNTGGGALAGSASTAAPFSIVGAQTYDLSAGEDATIAVRFTPAATGQASGSVMCTGGAGAIVALSGTGTASPTPPVGPPLTTTAIAVDATVVAFGLVPVSATADRTFTVRNAGVGTLSGSAFANAPYSIVGGGTYSLGGGQSQTVTARFAPTQAGPANGSVNLTGGGGTSVAFTGAAAARIDRGDEFLVNRDTNTDQRAPAVASLPTPATDGTVAVVIFSDDFDRSPSPTEPGHQHYCSAAIDARGVSLPRGGRVAVAHHSDDVGYIGIVADPASSRYVSPARYHGSNAIDPHPRTLFVGVVRSDGFDLGASVALDTDRVSASLTDLDVAVDPTAGNSFVTFRVDGVSTGPGAPPEGLVGRILGPSVPTWPEAGRAPTVTAAFRISSSPNLQQGRGRVAFDGSAYLVVWEDMGGISARRFDGAGNPFGGDFVLSAGPGAALPRVAPNPAAGGGFLVVWQEGAIEGRLIRGDGTLGARTTLSGATAGPRAAPSVAASPNGEWMVVWTGTDASGAGIVARRFDASLAPTSAESGVNQTTDGDQVEPSVTWVSGAGTAGEWLVVWTGFDADDRGVRGRYLP